MIFPIPENLGGVIFDVDGTLVDSMPVHLLAWQKAMASYGGSIDETEFYEMAGVPTRKMIELLNQRHKTKVPTEEGAVLKESIYFELIPQVRPIPEVVDALESLRGRLPVSVASGGRRYVVQQTLSAVGLAHKFDVIVCADDVVHGKPDPEMFLESARMMKVPPERCLVFEDGEAGIEAARRAKMKWIDVRRHGVTSSK